LNEAQFEGMIKLTAAEACTLVVSEHLQEMAKAMIRKEPKLLYQVGELSSRVYRAYWKKIQEHMTLVKPVESEIVV